MFAQKYNLDMDAVQQADQIIDEAFKDVSGPGSYLASLKSLKRGQFKIQPCSNVIGPSFEELSKVSVQKAFEIMNLPDVCDPETNGLYQEDPTCKAILAAFQATLKLQEFFFPRVRSLKMLCWSIGSTTRGMGTQWRWTTRLPLPKVSSSNTMRPTAMAFATSSEPFCSTVLSRLERQLVAG